MSHIEDELRATLLVTDEKSTMVAVSVIKERMKVTRMKNKFGLWVAAAHGDGTVPVPEDYKPPKIHMKLLFTAQGLERNVNG